MFLSFYVLSLKWCTNINIIHKTLKIIYKLVDKKNFLLLKTSKQIKCVYVMSTNEFWKIFISWMKTRNKIVIIIYQRVYKSD